MSTTVTATVARFAQQTKRALVAVLREAAQDVAENVSVGGAFAPGTPVDTGFARANWDATLGTPSSEPLQAPTGDAAETFSGTTDAMALVIATADLPDTITLYNNTEYLPFLEDGRTTPIDPQFRSGWIAETAHAWPTIVHLAAQRVRQARR